MFLLDVLLDVLTQANPMLYIHLKHAYRKNIFKYILRKMYTRIKII